MIRTSCRIMPGHAIDYEPTLFPPIPGCPSYIRQYFILRQKGSVTNLICNGLWLLYILLAEATFNHSDLREKRIKANDLSYNAICTCKLVYTRSAMGGDCTHCMDHSLTKFPSINQLFLNLYWHCRLVELQVKFTRYIYIAGNGFDRQLHLENGLSFHSRSDHCVQKSDTNNAYANMISTVSNLTPHATFRYHGYNSASRRYVLCKLTYS